MSRLEQLIQQLCPDGVEYKKLNEVVEIRRGVRVVRSQLSSIGEYPVYQNSLTPLGYYEKYNVNADTTFVIVAGAAGEIGYSTVDFWAADDCFYFEGGKTICSKFIYYVLTKNKHLLLSKVRKASVPRLSRVAIEQIIVPFPPLEIQREIVRILDHFTELTTELTEELTARKKQYEYYRDALLTFTDTTPLAILGEVAVVTKLAGFEFTKYVKYSDSGNTIALRGLNVKNGRLDLTDVKYIDASDFSKLTRSKLHVGDMLFTYVGTIGQVALIDAEDKYYLAPNVALIRSVDKRLNPQYMRYYFQSNNFWKTQINKLLQSSSMQNIPMEKIRKFVIPLPSPEEQNHIVSILDKFDALCNDQTSGLPAEIAARQKQYEYYRDKLLTFPERKKEG
ncbi:restriction endonuclease subunit S [Faecalibacterium sp. An121]|uniref:restriction endonuclease subunit S n=1 Tax=Faecalibacterium sp. An121 TaxID=1965550 RepID=UPI000B3691F2|nr:restriction endonuclease subunit S [Faecalibacterium sp. An121]OUQ37821.1 hypothetical protein B5E66_07565 [Faecalibacterium sp. An121]